MGRYDLPILRRLLRSNLFEVALAVCGLAMTTPGYTQFVGGKEVAATLPAVVRGSASEAAEDRSDVPSLPILLEPRKIVRAAQPDYLPDPQGKVPRRDKNTRQPIEHLSAPATSTSGVVPIGLDIVLRLAEEQNPQIGLARERVREAFAEKDVAASKWLPDLWAGTAYYRHEGGIQNEDGTLTHSSTGAMFAGLELKGELDIREYGYQKVNAQRKVWQQRGELSRISSETLLDAANTYIDLLAARHGELVSRNLEKDLSSLLKRAKDLAEREAVARLEVARIQAELDSQQLTTGKLHTQTAAAAAKLRYLLSLDPNAELVPVDHRLVPFDLVDASGPTSDLIGQALSNGPGIQEMAGLLALIQESLEKSQGASKFFPVFELRMAEGGFGAGPGDRMDWDNRWDLGVQARWNLTEALTARDRKRAAQAKIHQVHLAHEELRNKLTAGVQEAQETILGGKEQIRLAEAQIKNAQRAHELTEERLRENPQPSSYSEVLLAIAPVGRAQVNYLTAISAYDKAQLRLMILLGSGNSPVHTRPPAK